MRPQLPPGQPPSLPGQIGFPFEALPRAVYDDYLAGWLKPIDLAVVVEMIRWGVRRGRRDSCWTTRKVIARAIDRDPRTVQSSWSRLAARKLIERKTFDGDDRADGDDPDNHSGSRIYFNWAPGRARTGLDPAEAPPPRRKRGRPRKGAEPGGEKIVSPPREVNFEGPSPAVHQPPPGASISPPGGKSASPKEEDAIPKEERRTFNVAGSAGSGEGEPTADVQSDAGGELARAAAPAPVPGPAWSDAELAEKLVRKVRDGGVNLRVVAGPEGGELIQPVKLSPFARDLPPEVVDRLKRLRPHVLAYLKGGKVPCPPAADGAVPGPLAPRNAPKVRDPGRVRSLIAGLPGNLDPEAPRAAQRALSEALGDHDPESVRTFHGLAGDVARGGLAVGCLIDGFEEACGPKVRNRGAVFIAAVKRWKREHRRARPVGGRPPSPGARPG